MSTDFLHRDDAPFDGKVWEAIDAAVLAAAKGRLTARRLLHVEGPFGLGVTAVPGGEAAAQEEATINPSLPLAMVRKPFELPARDIAAFEQTHLPMNLQAAAAAAGECARLEDEIVFAGSKKLGMVGLLTAKGVRQASLRDWKRVGTAAEDLIEAVTRLDDAGFHGPYSLALSPDLYNRILRRYPQGNATEVEHIRTVVTDGVVKAPAIAAGGVLLASGRQFASIVLGQDLLTGLVGPSAGGYEFFISETLALRLPQPSAICRLKPPG